MELKIPMKRGRHKASEMYVPLSKFTMPKDKSVYTDKVLQGVIDSIMKGKKKRKTNKGTTGL